MIKGKLIDSAKYAKCHSQFAMCFEKLAEIAKNFQVGEIVEDDVRFLCQSYETKPASEKKLEVHRKFIDIQFLASGEETLYFGNNGDFAVKVPYDSQKDAEFLEGNPPEFLTLHAGEFCVFFPEDAHRGGCIASKACEVQKVVVKVPVE